MPDEHNPKRPSDPNASRDWEPASENDVERKLAQATELATELAGEVGAKPEDASTSNHNRGDDALKSIESGLDTELNELEQLVGQAKADVGATTAPQDRPPTRRQAAEIPDFMAEFTSPQPPQDSASGAPADAGEGDGRLTSNARPPEAAPGASADLAGAKPPPLEMSSVKANAASPGATGVTGAGPSAARSVRPGVIGTGTLAAASAGPEGSSAVAAGPSPTPDATTSRADASVSTVEPGGRSDLSGSLLLRLCERGVQVLERIDRPFARLGGRVRFVVGLIAITTAVASVVVFILSLM